MDAMEGTGEEVEFTFDGLTGTTDDFLASLKGLDVNLRQNNKKTKEQIAADLKLIATKKLLAALANLELDQLQKQIRSNLKQHA